MIAIITKEWKRLFRSAGAAWALAAYVLIPVAVSAFALRSLYGSQGLMPHMIPLMGAQSLNVVGSWQVLLISLLSLWVSASALAGESEGSTLELMLVSGQRLIGVVFAKLTAVVVYLWLIVLAGLPVFALPVMAGGMSWGLLGRVVLLEAAAVVAMAGLGLAVAAFGRRTGSVGLAAVALGLMLTLGTGLVGDLGVGGNNPEIIMMKWQGMPTPQTGQKLPAWLWANPMAGLNNALDQSFVQGMFPVPGAGAPPVYKQVPLWKAQSIAAAPVALLGALVAWLAMAARLRFRWPRWRPNRNRQPKQLTTEG